MTDPQLQDLIARIVQAQAATHKFVEESRKPGKFERNRAALVMTGAALFAVGAVVGGLAVWLLSGGK